MYNSSVTVTVTVTVTGFRQLQLHLSVTCESHAEVHAELHLSFASRVGESYVQVATRTLVQHVTPCQLGERTFLLVMAG